MQAIAPESLAAPVLSRRRRRLYLALVALLPLHTVFLAAWISWKPFVAIALVLVVMDAVAGFRERTWPWHRAGTVGATALLAGALLSWPGSLFPARFASLWLALGVGAAVMLTVERSLREPGMLGRTLDAVYWSAAAMAASAFVLGLVTVGAFGAGAVDAIGDLPGVLRIGKRAYLSEGFVALTNWHQDPGYGAAWMNLWAVLTVVAAMHGRGSGRAAVDAAIVGGLVYGTIMTFSRTGWVVLVLSTAITVAVLTWRRVGDRIRLAAVVAGAGAVAVVLLGITALADRPGVAGDLDDQFSFRLGQGLELGVVESEGDLDEPFEPDVRSVVWPMYVDFFEENPLRGIGLGTGWATPGVQEPHNLVLQLLGETGLIGLAGFVVLLAVVVARGRGVVGWLALATALLAALTQTVLFEPTWWFAAGLALGGGPRPQPRT